MALMCKLLFVDIIIIIIIIVISLDYVILEQKADLFSQQLEPRGRPHRPIRRFWRQQQFRFRPWWDLHFQRQQAVQGYYQGRGQDC
jgi:hypothetical protein